MTSDPEFDTFWAIFPRKDGKPEARHEWGRAVNKLGPQRIILTAARYCADVHGKPRAGILPPGPWLLGLEEPDDPEERPAGVLGLDQAKVGNALLTAVLISWQLGHGGVSQTIRDYIYLHGPFTPERDFVYRVLLGEDPRDLLTEDEALAWLAATRLPKLDA